MTHKLTKVDLAVREKMLQYPSLFPTRFHALARIFEHWHWNDRGELVEPEREKSDTPSTVENFLSHFEAAHARDEKELDELDTELRNSMLPLYGGMELDSRLALHMARAVADNIDLVAASNEFRWGADRWNSELTWLVYARHYSLEYYAIVPKEPDVHRFMTDGRIPPPLDQVDPEWKSAIVSWAGPLATALNYGWSRDKEHDTEEDRAKYVYNHHFRCSTPEMQPVWDFVHTVLRYYRPPAVEAAEVAIAERVIAKLRAETDEILEELKAEETTGKRKTIDT